MADPELMMPPTIRVAAAKPKFNIYYALLIIALCAMLISCGVLYKFVRDFGGFGSVKGKVSWIAEPTGSDVAELASIQPSIS